MWIGCPPTGERPYGDAYGGAYGRADNGDAEAERRAEHEPFETPANVLPLGCTQPASHVVHQWHGEALRAGSGCDGPCALAALGTRAPTVANWLSIRNRCLDQMYNPCFTV